LKYKFLGDGSLRTAQHRSFAAFLLPFVGDTGFYVGYDAQIRE
jgi:hypothetical protein